MDKLELKYIAPYLPYGLRIHTYDDDMYVVIQTIRDIHLRKDNWVFIETSEGWDLEMHEFQPILRPLSDLILPEHILGLGFRTLSYNLKEPTWTLKQIEYLYKNHFDLNGLIESDLALDINTINQ